MYLDHFKFSFIAEDNFIPEETLEAMLEFELLVGEENYDGDDSLAKLMYHDLSTEDYKKKSWKFTESSELEVLEDNHFFSLHQTLQQRKRIIQEGYRQMVYAIQQEHVGEVTPLYFFNPYPFKMKDGSDQYRTLFDYKDKVVFLGLTATGLNALNPTPYSQRYTMAALSPMALNTILTESYILREI